MTVLDASTLINLRNAGILGRILDLPGRTFGVGPQVLLECRYPASELCSETGVPVVELSDDNISASAFFHLQEQYGLGMGETECLVLAQQIDGRMVCSDDRRARAMCVQVLGEHRVTGSIGLLREAVSCKLITAQEATHAVQKMRSMGGYLPELPLNYFDLL